MDEERYQWGEVEPTGFDCSGLLQATEQAASFWNLDRLDEEPED
jgi:cell wall-associated NlpC family hydrolase